MGAYWVRMNIRPGADEVKLQQLLDLQSQAYGDGSLRLASWFNEALRDIQDVQESDDLIGRPMADIRDTAERSAFRAVSEAILDHVILDERNSESNQPGAFRTNPIDRTSVLPCEWAYRGVRSYLAPDLERHVAKWRAYFEATRRGSHRAYHMQRYLYEQSCALYDQWLRFRTVALRSCGRANPWAQRPSFQTIRTQLLVLPPPSVEAAPLWEHWREVGSITADQWAAYEAQQAYQGQVFPLARDWNHSVPRNQKRPAEPLTGMVDVDTFIESLNHPWVEECLHWLEETAAAGKSVYLDA